MVYDLTLGVIERRRLGIRDRPADKAVGGRARLPIRVVSHSRMAFQHQMPTSRWRYGQAGVSHPFFAEVSGCYAPIHAPMGQQGRPSRLGRPSFAGRSGFRGPAPRTGGASRGGLPTSHVSNVSNISRADLSSTLTFVRLPARQAPASRARSLLRHDVDTRIAVAAATWMRGSMPLPAGTTTGCRLNQGFPQARDPCRIT